MKYSIVTICLVFMAAILFAQAPNYIRYQAAIQNSSGSPMVNQTVALRISLLYSKENKERVYAEFHSVTTDDFGMINLKIGNGNVISGQFSEVDWGAGAHFLRIELDENGGSNFKLLSEVELLSVPYALHAKSADNVDDADADATNEIQELSLDANVLSISNGNSIILSLSTEVPATDAPVPVAFRGSQIFAHPTDNAQNITFGEFTATSANSDYDGQANTAAIVSALGDGSYAAKFCDDLSAFGFNDWYLPSRAELDAIFKQNYLLADYGLDDYWSSSETSANKSWSVNFLNGVLSDRTKNKSGRCLCVRKN